MGSDVSGNIAFGIPTSEDLPIKEILAGATKGEGDYWDGGDDEREWEEIYFAKKTGSTEPSYETQKEAWTKWLDDKHKFMKNVPIQIMFSGHGDELGYNIIIQESEITSEWGDAVTLEPFVTKPEWIPAIKDFCETMGIPYQEPVWFLSSLYF